MSTEEELRERLRALAGAARLPVPRLEVQPDAEGATLPTRVCRGDDGEWHVVASSGLLAAGPPEQTWHLASALGWWASPVPRRRRRQHVAVLTVFIGLSVAFGLASLFENVHLPTAVVLAGGPLLGGVVSLAYGGLTRRERRSLDAAGHGILAASGHFPAATARQVFGGRPPLPWHKRWIHAEPPPAQRITDAEAWSAEPHRSLY